MVRWVRIPNVIQAPDHPGVTGSAAGIAGRRVPLRLLLFFAFREELQRLNCGPEQVLKLLQMTYTLFVWCFL